MKLICKHNGLELEITDSLLDKFYNLGMEHYPKEFGGLLIGSYSEDKKTCHVTETILPSKYVSSKYIFKRGKEGLKQKLEEFYNGTPSLNYVGEWHTHPDAEPEPSAMDKQAMKEISGNEDVLIASPILLILGIGTKKLKIGAYIHFNNQLYKYHEK